LLRTVWVDYARKGEPDVILIGRREDGNPAALVVKGFRPYFYAEVKDGFDPSELERLGGVVEVEEVPLEHPYGGDRVELLRIVTTYPKVVPKLREQVKKLDGVKEVYEADIPFVRRAAVDLNLPPASEVDVSDLDTGSWSGLPAYFADVEDARELDHRPYPIEDLVVASFDLEVLAEPGTTIKGASGPIIAISFAYRTPDGERRNYVITWKGENESFEVDGVETEVIVCRSEAAALRRFFDEFRRVDPDVVFTYNGDEFDLPYLQHRAGKLGIDVSPLARPAGKRGIILKHGGGRYASDIFGRAHVDLYHTARKNLKLERFTLEEAVKDVLDVEKEEMELVDINEAWKRGDLDELMRYSAEDAHYTLELGLELAQVELELSYLTRLPLPDATRFSFGQLAEWRAIYKARQEDILVPNKPTRDEYERRRRKAYKGAIVFEPEIGLHENVVCVDFASLYPNVMVAHNISPDTFDCDCCPRVTVEEVDDPTDATVAPDVGHKFCKRRKGFFPRLVEGLIERRRELKRRLRKLDTESHPHEAKILDVRQQAYKVLANSYYGYMGWANARWYCRECAESVTAWGRYYISEVRRIAEEKYGLKVVYGDTDSLFVKLPDADLEETIERVKEFLKDVNGRLPVELELEDAYKRILFVTKKKYAGYTEDGKIVTKGLEVVRRDWAPIARETQRRVLKRILADNDPEAALKEIHEVLERLKSGDVDIDELAVTSQLTKKPSEYVQKGPHVRAALRLARHLGVEPEPGTIVRYVIVRGPGSVSDKAYPVELVREEGKEPDVDYYIEHQILPAVERIMRAIGYSRGQIVGETASQKTLDQFFG